MRVRNALLLSSVLTSVLVAGVPARAAEATRTQFIASGPVVGVDTVNEENSGALDGQKVTIKYFRKANGKWVLKHKESPAIDGTIAYGDARPALSKKKGTCKMVATFKGTADYAGSKDSKRFDCKTGAIDYSS